jgi:hypothetical protein
MEDDTVEILSGGLSDTMVVCCVEVHDHLVMCPATSFCELFMVKLAPFA